MRLDYIAPLVAGTGLIMLASASAANAGEIKVLSTIGVRSALEELAPRFEQATKHRIVIVFEAAAALRRQIEGGEVFDVAILTAPITYELIRTGAILSGTHAVIARAGIGLAVRTGAARPDISSVEAFKRTLLGAKSITYPKEGASGVYFAEVLQRLGIDEAMKARSKLAGGAVAELVARGEAEFAVQLIPELLAVRGVELVGPFPAELQNYVVFAAGVGANAIEPVAGWRLVKFLTAPAVKPVIRSKGMEPG